MPRKGKGANKNRKVIPLGQRASCPLRDVARHLGQRASCPLRDVGEALVRMLAQRARRPLPQSCRQSVLFGLTRATQITHWILRRTPSTSFDPLTLFVHTPRATSRSLWNGHLVPFAVGRQSSVPAPNGQDARSPEPYYPASADKENRAGKREIDEFGDGQRRVFAGDRQDFGTGDERMGG